jgi:hypothetical protein
MTLSHQATAATEADANAIARRLIAPNGTVVQFQPGLGWVVFIIEQ